MIFLLLNALQHLLTISPELSFQNRNMILLCFYWKAFGWFLDSSRMISDIKQDDLWTCWDFYRGISCITETHHFLPSLFHKSCASKPLSNSVFSAWAFRFCISFYIVFPQPVTLKGICLTHGLKFTAQIDQARLYAFFNFISLHRNTPFFSSEHPDSFPCFNI